VLVRVLSAFEGTMIFVSHDRRFLSNLSNRVLEIDGGKTRTYNGGYLEYVQQTGHEAPGVC
jgi:ATPase subunit of ABC transporter with duplicated ATPase domains